MQRNYLPWQRPEGPYPNRDGLFLAVIAAGILLWEFRLQMVLVGIIAVAVLIFADNIREVIRR